MRPMWTTCAAAAAAIAVSTGGFLLPRSAQAEEVPVQQEPMHTLRLETTRYRIYDVTVPVGEATLFHRHSADNFAVYLSSSSILNERPDGTRVSASVVPGGVNFAAASSTASYVHRVTTTGGDAFRNLTIELLGEAAPTATTRLPSGAGFATIRESARGAAFRVELEPGASVTLPTTAADALLVCIKPATFVLSAGELQEDRWVCETGQFRLVKAPSATRISSPTPVPGALVAFIFN